MSDETPLVKVATEGGVARVTLARPDRHNAFDDALVDALLAEFSRIAEDRTVRVVVLAGEGKSFSAGADLGWMKSMATATVEDNVLSAAKMADCFELIHRMPQPVIARVHGVALGGGAGLVAAADIAVAAEGAQIGFTEARLGIIPGVISPYVVLKIGPAAAKR